MALATATSARESRFDPFLYAAVRDNADGAPLTVLSVLARQNIDPWEEAARLAQLSSAAAARVLARLIAALPAESATPPDSGMIAAQLIALLPRRSAGASAAQRIPPGGSRVINLPNRATVVARTVLYLIVLALLLVSQWVVVSHLLSLPARKPQAPAAMMAPARTTRPGALP